MNPAAPTECLDEGTVAALVTGALEPEELRRVEAHLAGCATCGRLVASAGQGLLDKGPSEGVDFEPERGERFADGTVAQWLRPGDVLAGKYRVETVVGRGGMGDVFSASHIELGHRVAIEVLRRDDSNAGARFLLEAQTCAHLQTDHVARVFDLGRLSSGAPYIVMEFLVGEDLAQIVARGPVPATAAAAYGIQACIALEEAHTRGIVHRDLKPANLFLTQRDDGSLRLKVLDFGISRFRAADGIEAQSLTATGALVGTPLYMSPEQLLGHTDVDARSDLWSLGTVLFELLTGGPPFRGPTLPALTVAITTEAPLWPPALRVDLPTALVAVVMKCLEKDRDARFSTARELMTALAPFAETPSAVLDPPRFRGPNRPPTARGLKGIGVAVSGVVALLVIVPLVARFRMPVRANDAVAVFATPDMGSSAVALATPGAPGAPDAGECFDVRACFADSLLTVPVDDPAGGCVVNKVDGGPSLNVALVVNTAHAGNQGVCGPAGCLIPLDRDPVSGWQPAPGIGIRLPTAICREMGGRLQSVALTTLCPTKAPRERSCAVPDTCVASEEACPATWLGYSCSGSATPAAINSQLVGCWRAPNRLDSRARAGKSEPWCCTIGAVPSTDPLSIDDMSGGPQAKLKPPPGTLGGWWWVSSDVPNAPLFPPPLPALFTYAVISPPAVPKKGGPTIAQAACLSSKGFSGWIAMEGLDFAEPAWQSNTVAPCVPYDASAYSGVRFWAASRRGDQRIKVAFPDQNTETESSEAACRKADAGGRCGDDWAIQSLPLTPSWSEYIIPWSALKQSSGQWGAKFSSFDSKHVIAVWFGVEGPGPGDTSPPFDFCISDISFTR